MASVNSPIRKFIKPLFYKLLGRNAYKYVQTRAKIKDIRERLVEEKEMQLLPQLVKEGDETIDLGANYAYYLERLSKLVGNRGKVYGFEPIPFTYDVCNMVVRKLRLNNVEVFQYAAGAKNEGLEFRVPKLDFGGISAGQSHLAKRNNDLDGKENYYSFKDEEIVKCKSVTIDSFLEGKLSRLTFVKIDIEGAEYYALQGMRNVIAEFKPVVLIEIQPFFLKGMGVKESELVDLITKELDYSIYAYDVNSDKLLHVQTNLWDDNYILFHNSKLSDYKHIIS